MPSFPTPSQIFERYKTTYKGLKPDFNEFDTKSDVLIRARALTGIAAGLYGDQLLVNNDTFVLDARNEALDRHGADYNLPRQPATAATSNDFKITGTNGAIYPIGSPVRNPITGILYATTTLGTIALGEAHVGLQCNVTGSAGNVPAGEELTVVTPPAGIDPTGELIEALASGADIETADSYRARLLTRKRRPPSGGNEFDYPAFAFAADPSVRTAFIRRFGRGLGTVDIYITTGTTDIDTAVTQGLPISRIPSPGVIATVQAYYEHNAPLTDCPKVFAPTEIGIDVTVNVVLATGISLSTVPANATYNPLNLTVDALIKREIGRVLYKLQVGGRVLPGDVIGYVVAADIEYQLDIMLSAVTTSNSQPIGKIPVLVDRQCQPLDPPNIDRALGPNQLSAPGTLTVVLGV